MELDIPGIALRISIMYPYALALLRISGKQSVGHLTAMDFVVVTIIGDLFDDVFWAEVPILQGMAGFATIILVHILVTYLASRNMHIHNLFTPRPSIVVQKGRLVSETLQHERTRAETVQFEMRLKGEEHLNEVEVARWEPKGRISILKARIFKWVKKKDLD